MPRRAKAPRLAIEPAEHDGTGRLVRHASWVIRYRGRRIRTGCRADEAGKAQRKLAEFILAETSPARERSRDPASVVVADVIGVYSEDVAPTLARPKEALARMSRLLDHLGGKRLSEVTGAACRAYARKRGAGPARRELEDLRAAARHYHREGFVTSPVAITLPERAPSRERWLTRSEAARLIRAAWRLRQTYKGEATARRVGKHVARFILVALYTGTRAGAVCGAAIRPTVGRGYVDLERGVFYRRAPGSRETKKRQPPVPLPDRLLAHLRRWERLGLSKAAVVEWNGQPVRRVHKGFRAARLAGGLGSDVVPHTLRHTAATWLMQDGVEPWEAAGYLGMSLETLQRVYGHHHERHLEGARKAMSSPGRYRDGNARTEREQEGSGRVAK